MQIAMAIVPEMLRTAAGDARQPRELPAHLQELVDSARRVPPHLDGMHPACVYFIARGDRFKIGYTTHLRRRLEALHAQASDVLLTLGGGVRLEGALHERFADFRVGTSEWFERAACVEDYVRKMRLRPLVAPAPPLPRDAPVSSLARYPVEVEPEELRRVAAMAYRQGDRGVHLSAIVAIFRAEGHRALWSLAALARAYEEAGVTVRSGVRVDGRVHIGIHRDDLPPVKEPNTGASA
ncbi:GIY-YIG nuclease family protein [Streptomyces fuscigenes]|uniref:GIY-YIG nuclease family protein n=1 Tax=Streptomyces fuscigenes TaxID=1528880 RepID=UPI001F191334|nr:GIY-YIG nuclease family protein [Streptomyces fuscigenes]MCF3960302.1 GIY-YIG nuclease family protein [Streptomyces fuscigenes]